MKTYFSDTRNWINYNVIHVQYSMKHWDRGGSVSELALVWRCVAAMVTKRALTKSTYLLRPLVNDWEKQAWNCLHFKLNLQMLSGHRVLCVIHWPVPLVAHRQSVQAQGAAAAADGCQAAENHRDDERSRGEAAAGERICKSFCFFLPSDFFLFVFLCTIKKKQNKHEI